MVGTYAQRDYLMEPERLPVEVAQYRQSPHPEMKNENKICYGMVTFDK